jgi:signal transduction histidine kinase
MRLGSDGPLTHAQAQQLRFEVALENMGQGLCFFDGAQRLIVSNRRYAELYDLPPDGVRPGMSLRDIIDMRFAAGSCPRMTEEDYHSWRNNVAVAQQSSESIVEMRNGRTIVIRHQPMPDGGWVATHEDITERRRQEEELRRSNEAAEHASRAKSEFLANMSHELRTPLNAIIGFSEILKDETFGPGHPGYRGYAADIHESGSHLLKIINEILDMSKIEAGKLDLHESEFDVGEVVVSCEWMMRERAIEAGVTLVYEPPKDGLPAISADPTKLKQILLNLLSNSIKFTPRGGTVSIVLLMVDDNRLAIVVRDTGIGMNAEDMAIALQPFRQIDNSHTRRHQGTGLGLPLAKALTELHGGELRIVSEFGHGTTVTVLLPTPPAVEATQLSA